MTFGYMTISHFLRIVYGIGYRVKHIEANRWTWGLCHSLCPQDLFPQGEWVFELRAGVMGVKGAGAGHKMGSTPVNDWQRLLREVTKMHRTGTGFPGEQRCKGKSNVNVGDTTHKDHLARWALCQTAKLAVFWRSAAQSCLILPNFQRF